MSEVNLPAEFKNAPIEVQRWVLEQMKDPKTKRVMLALLAKAMERDSNSDDLTFPRLGGHLG